MREIQGVDLEQIVCRTSEALDLALFSSALKSLTDMHPVLRTRFVWDTDQEPRQEIVEDVTPPVCFVDLTTVPESGRSLSFRQRLFDDRQKGLSLAEAPLVRATVLHYGEGDTRILLTLHHAIVDGRCFPVLLDDLFSLYRAHAEHLDVAGQPATDAVP